MWRRFYVLMAEADAGEGGGSSGGGDGGSAADTSSGAAQGGSVLSAAGEGTSQPPAIPEKYQVKKEDGSVDIEASSLKLAEAYGHLEKRMGSGDVPPKTPEEYEVTIPDAYKDVVDPKTDPLLSAFLKDAHAAGFTQKQVDLAMGKYFEIAPALLEGDKANSEEACIAELKTEWKTDEQFKAEVGKAYKAAVAYGDKDAEVIMQKYGNDPAVIRLLARVGNELGEDTSLNPGGTLQGGQTVEQLMMSEAYSNPKHADHAKVSAQVKAYHDKLAAQAARSGNAPLM